MSTAISVWSRVIEPGQDTLISEEVSLQITNITLEYDESKPASDKRSVLKMQHLTANPALLYAAAQAGYGSEDGEDYDSEIDSDEYGGSDEDEGDEEDDLDDELMADLSKVSKASKASSSSASKKKVNGELAAELEGEDEDEMDEEEDNSEDDSEDDEDYDREEAEVQICSFIPGKVEQFTTNLILPGDEDFVLKLSGDYKVHLFGHYIMQPQPDLGGRSSQDYDSDLEYDSEFDEDDLSELDEELDEDDESRIMEITEEKPEPKKVAKEIPELKKEAKVAKAESATPAPVSASEDKSKLSKNQLKKLAQKEKAAAAAAGGAASDVKPAAAAAAVKKEEAKPASAAAAATTTAAKKAPSKKQTLPSGLVIEDNKTGTGALAKSGQRVQMRYIGRLANGKIFDQNTKGSPFSFKLGKGEVIKGWDEGIAGMQVGGERRLVIPPGLAYGKQAISGIPPNSTLTFEVKLLAIK